MLPFNTIFVSKRKKREKAAKKLQLFIDAQELWNMFQSVHNKIYAIKISGTIFLLGNMFHMSLFSRIHALSKITTTLLQTFFRLVVCSDSCFCLIVVWNLIGRFN